MKILISYVVLLVLSSPALAKDDSPDRSAYLNDCIKRIRRCWYPPKHAGWSPSPQVRFKLMPDGKICDPRLERASDSIDADNAAMKAIEDASPLRAFPKEWKSKFLDIRFTFALFGKKQIQYIEVMKTKV